MGLLTVISVVVPQGIDMRYRIYTPFNRMMHELQSHTCNMVIRSTDVIARYPVSL